MKIRFFRFWKSNSTLSQYSSIRANTLLSFYCVLWKLICRSNIITAKLLRISWRYFQVLALRADLRRHRWTRSHDPFPISRRITMTPQIPTCYRRVCKSSRKIVSNHPNGLITSVTQESVMHVWLLLLLCWALIGRQMEIYDYAEIVILWYSTGTISLTQQRKTSLFWFDYWAPISLFNTRMDWRRWRLYGDLWSFLRLRYWVSLPARMDHDSWNAFEVKSLPLDVTRHRWARLLRLFARHMKGKTERILLIFHTTPHSLTLTQTHVKFPCHAEFIISFSELSNVRQTSYAEKKINKLSRRLIYLNSFIPPSQTLNTVRKSLAVIVKGEMAEFFLEKSL